MSAIQELIDSRGRRISRRELFVAMGMTTLAGSFGSMWLAMTFGMPLIMFMQAIGASGLVIGLVTTVRLLAISASIPAALASENLDSRKPFWFPCALTQRLLWFIVAGLVFWCPPSRWWLPFVILAIIGVSDLMGNASNAPWLSWMADLIPVPIAGRFWGVRQSVVTAASLCGLVLAGQILDAMRSPGSSHAGTRAFALVFAISACLGVADILVHAFVREPRPTPTPCGAALRRRILAPFENRNFRCLTFSLGAWSFGISMIGAFALVYLKRDFGVAYSQLVALSIAGALGAVITGYGFGEIADRIGAGRLGAILMAAAPLPLAAWLFVNHSVVRIGPFSFPQSIAVLCASSVVSGAIYCAVGICQLRLAADLSAPQGRTMAMAVHWTFVGLLAALGPTAGGLVMDYFPSATRLSVSIVSGLPFSFYHAQLILCAGIIWFIALPMLLAIRTGQSGRGG